MNVDWAEVECTDFDVVIVACGYEARSIHVVERYSGARSLLLAVDYGSFDLGSYNVNRSVLEREQDLQWLDARAAQFGDLVIERLTEALKLKQSEEPLRVLFDISSCSRAVIAKILLAMKAVTSEIRLTCAYAVSQWFAPPTGELPSTISEPVVGDLSGWSNDLTHPPCAVIGLGFEPGRALGSIDYLEVPEVRLFLPQGPDKRFYEAVLDANDLLLSEAGRDFIRYDIRDPLDLYQKLISLTVGLISTFRPIVIPLGPKIFAALSILVAIELEPLVCVWRVSAGEYEDVADRSASGEVVAFEYRFPKKSVPVTS